MRSNNYSTVQAIRSVPAQWQGIANAVLATPAHTNQQYGLHVATHPQHLPGFYPSVGQNLLAKEHWRLKMADGRQLHVLVFDDHYKVHWDHYDAHSELVMHLLVDAKQTVAIGAILIVGLALLARR